MHRLLYMYDIALRRVTIREYTYLSWQWHYHETGGIMWNTYGDLAGDLLALSCGNQWDFGRARVLHMAD